MIISSLIASIVDLPSTPSDLFNLPIASGEDSNPYLNGEYRTILTLVSVLPLGKAAKRLADRVIDHCDGVQNLRKAVYDYKVCLSLTHLQLSRIPTDLVLASIVQLKADAAPNNSVKQNKLLELGFNYLYRYGTLVVSPAQKTRLAHRSLLTFPVVCSSPSGHVRLPSRVQDDFAERSNSQGGDGRGEEPQLPSLARGAPRDHQRALAEVTRLETRSWFAAHKTECMTTTRSLEGRARRAFDDKKES